MYSNNMTMKKLLKKGIWMFFCGLMFTVLSCDKELTILGEDSSNLHALESQKETFENNGNVKLSFRPNSFENTRIKAYQDFINKTGIYDVILQYNFSLSTYVEKKFVWPFDSLLEKYNSRNTDFEGDLYSNAWKEVGWYYKDIDEPDVNSIQKIGYPFATNTILLVYNKKLFESERNKKNFKKKYYRDLTVPIDWTQFKQVAEFFTTGETRGICMQGAEGSWLYYEYCTILYGMGGSVFKKQYGWEKDSNTEITIASPESVEATKYYLDLYKKCNGGGFYNVDATEQVKLIQEGKIAMGLVWSDYLYGLVKSGKSSKFGFAPIPGNTSPIAGGCYYVNRNTEHPEAAVDFILYMMQPETQVQLALKGLCSPLQSTYKDKRVKEGIPYSQALATSLERGTYMFEAGLASQFVSDIITEHIQRLCRSDNPDVEATLKLIANDIDDKRKKAKDNTQ